MHFYLSCFISSQQAGGKMMSAMVKGHTTTSMVMCTRENGKTTRDKERASTNVLQPNSKFVIHRS